VAFPFLTKLHTDGYGVGASIWLKQWSEANQKTGANLNAGSFIGIYFAFGLGSSALTVIQTMVLWIFCSIEVGVSWNESSGVFPLIIMTGIA
jgi:hypothetical protein